MCGEAELNCSNTNQIQYLVILAQVVFVLFFLAYKGIAWRNRSLLREKFGLPGGSVTDLLLWVFCAPCALCQETRTMMANNVQNGMWHGPDAMMVPSASMV